MENDIVLFRYADALLMKSEAKVRNGASGDEELNEVRSRVNASSRPATLENILAERQLELAWEVGDVKTWFASGSLQELTVAARNCRMRETDILPCSLYRRKYG